MNAKYVSILCSLGTKSFYRDESQNPEKLNIQDDATRYAWFLWDVLLANEKVACENIPLTKNGEKLSIFLSYSTKTEKFFRSVKSWIRGRSLELKGNILLGTRMNLVGMRGLQEGCKVNCRVLEGCIHPQGHEHQYSVDSNLNTSRGHYQPEL